MANEYINFLVSEEGARGLAQFCCSHAGIVCGDLLSWRSEVCVSYRRSASYRLTFWAAALFLGMATTLSACTWLAAKDDPATRRKAAVELTRKGLFALQRDHDALLAEQRFRQALESDPQYADARANLAFLLQRQGKHREAISHLQAAVKADSNNAAAYNNLGVAYDVAGQPGLAVNAYKQALKLDSRLRGTRLNLAVAYGHLGRYDLAETTFLQLLREDPTAVAAYAGLGAVYIQAGRFDNAVHTYQRGLAVAPSDPNLLAGLGVVYDMAGNPTAAVEAYDKALRFAPHSSDILVARGTLALKLGEYSVARRFLSEASRIEWEKRRHGERGHDPKMLAETQFALGDIQSNLGAYAQAAREYARAITLDPTLKGRSRAVDPDAHFALGIVFQEGGYLREAKAEYERVLATRSDDWAAWRNLGETLYELGNLAKAADRHKLYEQAQEAFTKALQIKRDDARAHYGLGLLYYRQANLEESYLKKGKYRLAALEFQNALPEYDGNPELHLNLGTIFYQLEQYGDAAKSFARAATMVPESAVPLFWAGLAERQDKRYENAVRWLEKAAALEPENQDPLYALGIVFDEMNQPAKAQEYYARAARASARGFAQPITTLIRE